MHVIVRATAAEHQFLIYSYQLFAVNFLMCYMIAMSGMEASRTTRLANFKKITITQHYPYDTVRPVWVLMQCANLCMTDQLRCYAFSYSASDWKCYLYKYFDNIDFIISPGSSVGENRIDVFVRPCKCLPSFAVLQQCNDFMPIVCNDIECFHVENHHRGK